MRQIPLFIEQNLILGISTKADGNIDFRFGSTKQVSQNRTRLIRALGANIQQVIEAEQVHKTNVVRVDSTHQSKVIKDTDGLMTSTRGVLLMLRIADCIPVFLYDPKQSAIALVHSGWKGSVGKIVLVAIEKMMLELKTNPSDLRIVLGPSIQACCNIWDKPPLELELPEWAPFVLRKNEGYAIDLPGFVRATALKAGVKPQHIKVSPSCTVMDKGLFSCQRTQNTCEPEGRFAAFIALKR